MKANITNLNQKTTICLLKLQTQFACRIHSQDCNYQKLNETCTRPHQVTYSRCITMVFCPLSSHFRPYGYSSHTDIYVFYCRFRLFPSTLIRIALIYGWYESTRASLKISFRVRARLTIVVFVPVSRPCFHVSRERMQALYEFYANWISGFHVSNEQLLLTLKK